ncbi:short-chain dehydrogenase [Betaproteobacteria bacterium]|nr:short-chain dehydrogenase [Betaproteobacteria bacterium]
MSCSPPLKPFATFTGDDRILVTGASSGIGAAIALQLNALGATVIANGRSAEKLDAVKTLAERPEVFHLEARDLVSEMEGLSLWVKGLRKKYGILTGLAHAAGRTITASFMEYESAQLHELFNIDFYAPFMLSKAILDRRNSASGASLVFIAAAAAIAPNKGLIAYGAAKAALVCAARGMSKEFAARRIRVNCISPGLTRTPMLEETVSLLGDDFLKQEESLYPLGFGKSGDVADLTTFLLSPAARWITGQNYVIDGGRLA